MTTNVQMREREMPPTVGPGTKRWTGWSRAVILIVFAVLAAAGLRWNSCRPENCYRRGRRALLTGDRQMVIRESRRLLGIPGYELRGRLLAGLLLARTDRPAEALQDLQGAAKDNLLAGEALTAAAECYYLLGQYVEAIHAARAALESDEDALDARRWLAAAWYDLGATGDAAAELKIISARATGDSRPDRLLGLINKDNEQFTEAVEHYRESLRRDPRQPDRDSIRAELAESLIKLSRFDAAREALQECGRTAPVLTLEAECLQNQGRTDEAEKRFHEALELDPQYFSAHLKLGSLLLLQSRAGDAIGVLEEAVRLAPHSSQAHFQLSQAYARQGARDQVDRELRLMRTAQAVEREFTDLHEAAAKKPNDAEIRYRIAVVARRLGKPDLARLWIRAALAIEPDHSGARAALIELGAR